MGSSLCNQTRLYACNQKKEKDHKLCSLSGLTEWCFFVSVAGTGVANNSQVDKT